MNTQNPRRISECRACGANLSNLDGDYIQCPKCHTRYDLVNRITDDSETIISPSHCKHRKTALITGSQWVGDNGSGGYDVRLCLFCGEFRIIGRQNGQHYQIRFTLTTPTQIEAVSKYLRYLEAED